MADGHLLEQILINILLNAAQATTGKGPIRIGAGAAHAWRWRDGDCRVGRSFASDDEVVAITVVDHGPGIPPGDLERIFEPFFSTKGRGQGSGLGLAICHSLIEALRGALVVTSQVGAGTTVRVLLPAARPGPALESASAHEERSRRGG